MKKVILMGLVSITFASVAFADRDRFERREEFERRPHPDARWHNDAGWLGVFNWSSQHRVAQQILGND